MPEKGFVTVTIREDTRNRMARLLIRREKQLKVLGIEGPGDLIDYAVNKLGDEEMPHDYLEHMNAYSDHVTIIDHSYEEPKLFNVYLRGGTLYCDEDKRDDCKHVGFALSLDVVRRKLGKSWF